MCKGAPFVRGLLLWLLVTRACPRRRGRGHSVRRLLAVPVLGAVAVLAPLVAPGVASADSSSSLTVIGTSDVSDSGLIPNVIQPGFRRRTPSTRSSTSARPPAPRSLGRVRRGRSEHLIVHAASLENQFVAGGYSYEQYGRALWTNDFVLAGAHSDPAGVAANAANNIVQAFADVAAAGMTGKATIRLARRYARHHRVRARHLADRRQFRAEPRGPAPVHGELRQRRRRDADRRG